MRLRRFVGADVAAATRLVRERLGPEAVILATRAHGDGIEITAAVDGDLLPPAAGPPVARGDDRREERDGDDGATLALGGPAALAAIAHELHALRAQVSAIDRTLAPLRTAAESSLGDEARDLARRLALAGFAPAVADAVAAHYERQLAAGASASAALAAGIASELLASPPPPEARVNALVGPTGAGKTTTIAKLAAARRRSGESRIGLVMADTYRIGAGEQLGTYARLLGLPMRVVRDGGELQAALRAFADCATVYVDTTGFGGDPAVAADVCGLLAAAGEPLAITAVVSAATAERALEHAWTRLDPLAPVSCVLTKVDEGANPAVCAWLAERRIPVRWIGTGQRVPEDLVAASGTALAEFLLAS